MNFAIFDRVREVVSPSHEDPPITEQEIQKLFPSQVELQQEFVDRLWRQNFIQCTRIKKELDFSSNICMYLNYKNLDVIFRKSPPSKLSEVRFMDFTKYALFDSWAPGLFLKYCPNLSTWEVTSERFFDRKVVIGSRTVMVNRSIMSHYFSHFDAQSPESLTNRSSKLLELFLDTIHKMRNPVQIKELIWSSEYSEVVSLLQVMDTYSCSYFRKEVDDRLDTQIGFDFASTELIQIQGQLFKIFDPLAAFLTDTRLRLILERSVGQDIRGSIRSVELTLCSKLTPKAFEILVVCLPNLTPSCLKKLLTQKQFCDREVVLQGEKILLNIAVLVMFCPDSKNVWHKLEELQTAPQVVKDFIDVLIGVKEPNVSILRMRLLFEFVVLFDLRPNIRLENRFKEYVKENEIKAGSDIELGQLLDSISCRFWPRRILERI
jgi:hypothetical protein